MESIDLRIEEARASFMVIYKKQRLLNNVALGVVVLLIIAAYVILQAWLNLNYVALGAVAVILVLLFVYSRISRTKIENSTKKYIYDYYGLMKEKTLPPDRFPNASIDFEKKLELSVFTDAGILKDIVRINSRGVISFQYKGQPATLCDMASYTAVDGKQTPSFLGKFLSVPVSFDTQGRILVYLKPKLQGKGPNALDDLKKLDENDRWVFYGAEGVSLKSLPSSFWSVFETLEVDDLLVDATFSIKSSEVKVALSYTDALMVLPLQNPFDPKPSDHFIKDFQTVMSILDTLK